MAKLINWVEGKASTITIVLSMLAGGYVFRQDIKADSRDLRQDIKADMEKFEARMEKIDERWVTLLKELHNVDKEVTALKIGKNS